MLNSFKKCDPEGQQKNFWESRVDLQTGKMVNKRSVAPISTVQSSNSDRKETSLLCFSSLTVQLPPRVHAEHNWKSGSGLGALKGLGLVLKMGHWLGVACIGNLKIWAAFVNMILNIDVEINFYFYKMSVIVFLCIIVFLYIMSFGTVFSRNGIYELLISIQL